jgi:hypothetical protein
MAAQTLAKMGDPVVLLPARIPVRALTEWCSFAIHAGPVAIATGSNVDNRLRDRKLW